MWPRPDVTAYQEYLKKLSIFALWLLTNGYEVELFSSDVGVDRYAVAELLEIVRNAMPAGRRLAVRYYVATTLDELLTQMARFRIVVTPKFHGVVFSHMCGKPVVALSYMPKINYLMKRAGCEALCLNIESFTAAELINGFMAAVAEKEVVQARVTEFAAACRNDLKKEFDDLCSAVNAPPSAHASGLAVVVQSRA
jgi:polysaccharide pyruvyl transferase WcaK-like protein